MITGLLWAQGEMKLVEAKVDPFIIVGLEGRTSNTKEASPNGVIPKFWADFSDKNLLAQIKDRVDDRMVALYTGYESDHTGAYTYILGAKVSAAKQVPAGMVAHKILAGNYAVFTGQGTPPPQLVLSLWKRIWSLEGQHRLHRAYQTDFEVYSDHLSANATTQVEIYVGLRG